jgi:hypothetical protein
MLALIRDYLRCAQTAADILRSEFGVDDLTRARRHGTFPKDGWLDLGERIHYSFHGVGCTVESGDEVIDFDFSSGGKVDGFDLWRLRQFLESRRQEYPGLSTVEQQEIAFSDLIQKGEIVKSGELPSPHLYRLCDADVTSE